MTDPWNDRHNPNDDDAGADWRNTRHQILACTVIDDDGQEWTLMYHDLCSGPNGPHTGLVRTFRVVMGETPYDMVLTGWDGHWDKFFQTTLRLRAGKKELLRPRPEYVKSVRFAPIQEN